jgi:hypothetical protein
MPLGESTLGFVAHQAKRFAVRCSGLDAAPGPAQQIGARGGW